MVSFCFNNEFYEFHELKVWFLTTDWTDWTDFSGERLGRIKRISTAEDFLSNNELHGACPERACRVGRKSTPCWLEEHAVLYRRACRVD